jgi:hypothetical protein
VVNATEQTPSGEVERTLDREIELLMSAINLVASGGAPAATVAGLRLAEAAMAVVAPAATDRGVIIDMLWGPDEHACDVRIRRGSSD